MRAATLVFLALLSSVSASSLKTLSVCDDVQEPPTLDPHKEFSATNHVILQQIYEGLVRFDTRGHIEPALAVSWSRPDPLHMRFVLRPNVFFHDGERFDAEAVRFTIARYLDPATGFPGRGLLGPMEKAEVVDPLTVDIVTKIPDGVLLNRLAAFVLIVPPKYVKERGQAVLDTAPAGTGPFRFEGRERGRSITLARNERYWQPGRPKLDRLIFRFLAPERQLEALKSGDVDILTQLPGAQTSEALDSGRIKIVKAPTFGAIAAAFNTSRKILSDVRVRRAINYAIDRQDLIFYDALGNGRPIGTLTMEGEEGHAAGLAPYPYDLGKAKRLLREAGYPNGFRLKAVVDSKASRAAGIIARQLADAGIRMDYRVFSDSRILAEAFSPPDSDIAFSECMDGMAHAYFIQSIFLYSKSPYSLAPLADYDRRLEAAAGLLDEEVRRKAFESLDRFVYDRVLALSLYQRIRTYGLREGVSFTPFVTGVPYFFDADVAERQ